MRIGTTWLAIGLVAAIGTAIAVRAGTARAEDEKGGGMTPPQKQVKHPVFDSLLGTWTTESKADWGNGKGKAAFALGVGGTAVLESYENRFDGAPAEATFHGHATFKVSDDGTSVTFWWLDSTSTEPMKMSGSLSEKGYDVKGTLHGMPMRITFERKGEGFEFKMIGADDKVQMTEVYTKAK